MKRVTIDVNEKEYARLKEIAADREVSVAGLLGAFVQDLTDCGRRGGSDESDRAWEWLSRNNFRYR
jgi:hypothetical protein